MLHLLLHESLVQWCKWERTPIYPLWGYFGGLRSSDFSAETSGPCAAPPPRAVTCLLTLYPPVDRKKCWRAKCSLQDLLETHVLPKKIKITQWLSVKYRARLPPTESLNAVIQSRYESYCCAPVTCGMFCRIHSKQITWYNTGMCCWFVCLCHTCCYNINRGQRR